MLQTTKHLNQKLPYKLVGVFGRWKNYLHSINKKKNSRNKSFHLRARFGAIWNASKKLIIINWKVPSTAWLATDFCFINKQTPQLLVLKIQTGSSFYLSAIYFRNSAKNYLHVRFLATDFCSDDLPEISDAHLLCH